MDFFKTGVAVGAVVGAAFSVAYYRAGRRDVHRELAVKKVNDERARAHEEIIANMKAKREQWEKEVNL